MISLLRLRQLLRVTALPLIMMVFVVAWVIRRKVRFRVVIMEPRFFGHLALESEVFIHDKTLARDARPCQVLLCTLGKESQAANAELWTIRKQSLPSLPSWIVSDIRYWQTLAKRSVIEIVPADYHRLNFLNKTKPSLPDKKYFAQRREEILSRFEFPSRPYVVFTVREVMSSEDLRNRQIQDFEPAMMALVQIGFNVIRLTNQTNNRISVSDSSLLDFQVRVNGRPLDELALVANASFVVSSTTGVDCLALAYRRPVLYIDAARFYYMFLGTELATIHMPRFVNVESGKPATLADLLNLGLGWVKHSSSFSEKGIKVVQSSPEEIRACVLQYAQRHSLSITNRFELLQNVWRSQLLTRHAEDVAVRHGVINARLSDWFLDNHGYEFVTGSPQPTRI